MQPSLLPTGGGNSVAVWMIEALRGDHDVTVFAWDRIDFESINRYYGTTIAPTDFRVIYTPRWLDLVRRALPVRAALLQRYLLLRWGRRLAPAYDVSISVNNEIDIGVRAMQYVHYPWGKLPRPDHDLRWFHRIPGVLRFYYWLASRLAPIADESIRNNHTLVNSIWTGDRFKSRYGGETHTLYPPVTVGDVPPLPWRERDDVFVALGRISHEKRLDRTIEIIERVRARGHAVKLRIIGSVHGSEACYREIARLAASRPWVEVEVNVSKEVAMSALAHARFGIHGMHEEHFGIAIAEMAMMGCIPFVPASGGQMEIVGGDERLMYSDRDDAVEKIVRILGDPPLQERLSRELTAHAQQFSIRYFQERFRSEVAAFLATRNLHR